MSGQLTIMRIDCPLIHGGRAMLIKLMPKTIQEIKSQYPDQWVWLANPERDANGNLLSGIVLFVGKDQSELYAKSKYQAFGEVVYWQTSQDPSRRAKAS
jgi:hypothetical protein